DGSLELLGRRDQQVKIRGVRVELGEVQAALVAVPGVHAAVVTAAAGPGGDRRLVAHLVATAAPAAVPRALRARLPQPIQPAPPRPRGPRAAPRAPACPGRAAQRPGSPWPRARSPPAAGWPGVPCRPLPPVARRSARRTSRPPRNPSARSPPSGRRSWGPATW